MRNINEFRKYKLFNLEEVLKFAKEKDIKVDESGYDITPYCESMFKGKSKDGKTLEQGFFYVQDREDASHLGGAFFYHFGFLRLTVAEDIDKLMTIEESIRNNFKWQMEHIEQFKSMENYKIILDQHLIEPTKEKPYTVYICGNDDFSWTLTYRTLEDAKTAIWNLCMRSEKIDYGGFEDALKDGRFVFTN